MNNAAMGWKVQAVYLWASQSLEKFHDDVGIMLEDVDPAKHEEFKINATLQLIKEANDYLYALGHVPAEIATPNLAELKERLKECLTPEQDLAIYSHSHALRRIKAINRTVEDAIASL